METTEIESVDRFMSHAMRAAHPPRNPGQAYQQAADFYHNSSLARSEFNSHHDFAMAARMAWESHPTAWFEHPSTGNRYRTACHDCGQDMAMNPQQSRHEQLCTACE